MHGPTADKSHNLAAISLGSQTSRGTMADEEGSHLSEFKLLQNQDQVTRSSIIESIKKSAWTLAEPCPL